MRVLSWFVGVVLVAVISTATAATLRAHNDTANGLTASNAPIGTAYVGSSSPDPRPVRHQQQSAAPPTAAPAPPGHRASAPPAQAVAPPPPPPPAIVIGSTQQALINRDRASAGLGALTWNACLYNVAASNANRMAAQGYISHTNGPNLDLGCGLGHQAGENVGYWSAGINDSQLNTMFMNSPDHRANIMGPYNYVATAWVVASNGYAYIAVEFG
ncbi:MAG TPA: CAP domain-containing protein [Candidatus Dormibacteraeota bacterium]